MTSTQASSRPVTQTDVWIPAEGGAALHAWLFAPRAGDGPFPAVTMAHGFAGLKYRGLAAYARRFAEAGIVTVVHDHRGFGLSGGAVPGDIDPWQQIADWRRVISFLETRPEVDASRIGLWGSSYAGGHALVLGATDRRLRAVVSQVPTISGYEQGLRRLDATQRAALEEELDLDERDQLAGSPPARQVLNSLDPGVRAAYRSQAVVDFQARFEIPPGVDAKQLITLRSTRKAQMYEPGLWAPRVAPTPLLMVVGSADTTTPTDLALEAFERAAEPKRLVVFDGGHYDAYVAAYEQTSSAATEWFHTHLDRARVPADPVRGR